MTVDPPTLENFCALATERARLHDPSFPALTPEGLVVTSQGLYGWTRELETCHWRLWADEKDDGPAAFTVEHWRATAKLGERHLVVAFSRVHDRVQVWDAWEPAPT